MKMRKAVLFILAIVLIMALIMTACSAPPQPEARPEPIPTPIEAHPTPTPSPAPTPEPETTLAPPEDPPPPLGHNLDPDIDYVAEFGFDIENYIFIENDIAQIFIPKYIEYSPGFEEKVMQAILWIEEVTGLDTLTNIEGIHSDRRTLSIEELNEMDEVLRVANIWNQIAIGTDKITIFPVSYPDANPAACVDWVALTHEFYLFSDNSYDSHEFGVLLHELVHVAHGRYTEHSSQHIPIVEGFAVWTTVQVAKNQGLEWLYQEQKDFYYTTHIIPSDMEWYFSGGWCPDDYFTNRPLLPYVAGVFFFTYLYETYGDGVIIRLFDEFDKRPVRYYQSSPLVPFSNEGFANHLRNESRRYVRDIKAVTSNDVFQDFDEWFKLNRTRYN
jgi:hypothetical protein